MRTTLLFCFFTCILSSANGQKNKKEEAVKKQVQAMINSWNRHDFTDMKNYTTADVDWINIVGMWWKGREEVQYAHQAFHNTMFKNVDVDLKSVTVRFINKKTAIVHIITYYGEFVSPGGNKMGNTNDIATLVYAKKKGTWLLTAGENVTVNEAAQQHDPVKEMHK